MVLNTKVALIGPINEIDRLTKAMESLVQRKVDADSPFYPQKLYKRMRGLTIDRTIIEQDRKHLILSFRCHVQYIGDILKGFHSYPVDVCAFSENERHGIWIVTHLDTIITHKFIPPWAIQRIILNYMENTNSPIMLDSYRTITFDRHAKHLVIRGEKLSDEDLMAIFFTETMRGKPIYHILSDFTISFYQSCINRYEDLYVSIEDKWEGEGTSPLGLFIVTFGVFGIIVLFLYLLGYI